MLCNLSRITDVTYCNGPDKIRIKARIWHSLCFPISLDKCSKHIRKISSLQPFTFIKSDRAFMAWTRGNGCATASLISEPVRIWVNFVRRVGESSLRDYLKFLSVNATVPSSMQMKPMTGICDRNHIFTHTSLIVSSSKVIHFKNLFGIWYVKRIS
jgi:hypothetical protein